MIAPHGGTLVNQCLPAVKKSAYQNIPSIRMSAMATSDLWSIATGAFSPLTGFLNEKHMATVLKDSRLGPLVWTIPITLDVTEQDASSIRSGREMGLHDTHGILRGLIEVSEVYAHDKGARCLGTFGTVDPGHPGVSTVHAMGAYLVSGRVWAFYDRDAAESWDAATPTMTRELFAKYGWKTVTGFQTRNAPHKAHEYLQRCALEHTDGLFVHPIRGWVKAGDFDPDIVLKAYRYFIHQFYPSDRVVCSGLNTAMRYAGPKEAVFHALIRKNFGCTHFIVGRDHAGVGKYYATYEAQNFFDKLPPLDIYILKFQEPFFCQRCGCVATAKTCGHDRSHRTYINGCDVRDLLTGQHIIPPHVMRDEMVKFLRQLQKQGSLFSEWTAT